MKRLVYWTFPFIVIVGTFLAAPFILGIPTSNGINLIEQQQIVIGTWKWTYYTFNLKDYVQGIANSINFKNLQFGIPNMPAMPTWGDILSANDLIDAERVGFTNILNAVIFVLNWIVYIVNWTLIIPKCIFYPFAILFTLLGLNANGPEESNAMDIYGIIANIMQYLMIPYIPYVNV